MTAIRCRLATWRRQLSLRVVLYSSSEGNRTRDSILDITNCHVTRMKRIQPQWKEPNSDPPVLRLLNSLTRQKERFVPASGRRVLWYSCGPTVYDASHMGHARSYITFDILRRVLQGYFNYDVFYVMNITDIDDKIIQRARRNFLMSNYVKSQPSVEVVLQDVEKSMQCLAAKLSATSDPDKREMIKKMTMKVDESVLKVKESDKNNEDALKVLLDEAKDPLSAWLDSKHGAAVTDHKIFTALTQYWEREFHRDMAALNVLPADVLTRVSEYVPEIVSYVEKIIENGYGYESNGSVYFDVVKFASSPNHVYAKLVPEAVGDLEALAEGEGELSVSADKLGEKHSEKDFALWKASKPGEPEWDSPWGKGRPGWHIECSVMSCDILGSVIDIHTGGVDLKFPHHDNEIAQAEAHYLSEQWVNYFLHAGHLTIEGCKMSKSLKNFITIKEALHRYTACQLRLAFLLHSWNSTLDYSVNTMKEAEQAEKLFNEFFLNAKDILRSQSKENEAFVKWSGVEKTLNIKFYDKQAAFHAALCDSVDTPSALSHMKDLVRETNIYVRECQHNDRQPNQILVRNIAIYLTDLLKMFGAISGEQTIGFSVAEAGQGSANVEEIAFPFVSAFAQFRDEVRAIGRQEKVNSLLQACDNVRDEVLPLLGVRLEDLEGKPAVVKFVDKDILVREKQREREAAAESQKTKEEAKRRQQEKQAAKDAQRQIPPSEMFRRESDKYSQFDEESIPTHDVTGQKLSESQRKKLKKQRQVQERLYAEYQKSVT
ncbi:cysteine--tRNA ligase, cytoplasmic-like [Corticium candelabrum]|uniref:cysteine--tRNA ligase, cytoplasmic-like n=1 Tax=Corticium candelabrum TaxID=121492 RepID=UPI002E26D695|nr:cysteine--tRNA ligase, cytoplasmic-like [Corticium candelabrum]